VLTRNCAKNGFSGIFGETFFTLAKTLLCRFCRRGSAAIAEESQEISFVDCVKAAVSFRLKQILFPLFLCELGATSATSAVKSSVVPIFRDEPKKQKAEENQ
jgi:hypothetical protein